ncbi:neural Wiskott-Aldrich syndrome protein [Microdochium nivale]|nr:neural Wiskott-Aldrich syndrome protein [Microdochium nivale]
MFAKTAIFAGLAAFAAAHQTMVNPKPFPGTSSSPLEPSGANFPCQATGPQFFAAGESSTWALGSKQTLSSAGTAVHGGGSAQFSMTYDLSPSQSTKWKVIHTVQGGMPARGLNDNLPGNDAAFPNPDTYGFTVPTNIPAGEVIFSWSWINRLGNREFYMFCAPVTLTGTGGSKANFDALPDMVILNIMGKASVDHGNDVEFADPGASVEDNLRAFGFSSELCCAAGCGESACKRTEGGSQPAPAPVPSAPSTPQPSATIPGGVFITVPPVAGSPAPQPTFVPAPIPTSDVVVPPVAAPSATPSAAPSPPVSPPANPPASPPATGTVPPTTGGSGGALSGACTSEGQWNCIDGKSFQQCGSGTWSTAMAVAQGTTCQVGQSTTLSISAAKIKRVVRAFRA